MGRKGHPWRHPLNKKEGIGFFSGTVSQFWHDTVFEPGVASLQRILREKRQCVLIKKKYYF